jgi:hypothetical protein
MCSFQHCLRARDVYLGDRDIEQIRMERWQPSRELADLERATALAARRRTSGNVVPGRAIGLAGLGGVRVQVVSCCPCGTDGTGGALARRGDGKATGKASEDG